MSDYSVPTPVWVDDATVVSDLAALRLSEHLVTALLDWQAHFEAHFAPGFAWDSEDDRRWYVDEGEVLRDRLSRAVGGCEVRLDLWPADS